jgi:hypothetical protein
MTGSAECTIGSAKGGEPVGGKLSSPPIEHHGEFVSLLVSDRRGTATIDDVKRDRVAPAAIRITPAKW